MAKKSKKDKKKKKKGKVEFRPKGASKKAEFELGEDVEPRFTKEQFEDILWAVGKPEK